MGRKNFNAFLKRQKAELKRKKKMEKQQQREERKQEDTSGNLEDMMAFVDEDGNIVSKPADEGQEGIMEEIISEAEERDHKDT